MALFDFIVRRQLRQTLESDYQELVKCYDAQAWKAVHILAGSIIEAILVDYVISENLMADDNAVKTPLAKLVEVCRERGLISDRVSSLMTVIREWRNLVHPGRMLRLDETVDKDSAHVARAVVNMIVKEIEAARRNSYGLTAKQLVAKLRTDPSAISIIFPLLFSLNVAEMEEFITIEIPALCAEANHVSSQLLWEYKGAILETISRSYRAALSIAPEAVREKAARRFAQLVREGSEDDIALYAGELFIAQDMNYLPPNEECLVREYLLGRLRSGPEKRWLDAADGLGYFLQPDEDDPRSFVDSFVNMLSRNTLFDEVAERFETEWGRASAHVYELLYERLQIWIDYYVEHERPGMANRLEKYLPVSGPEKPLDGTDIDDEVISF